MDIILCKHKMIIVAVIVPFSMGVARGGRALRDVIRQRVAGRALQGSYGEASAFSVDKCTRKCDSASADFAIRSLSPTAVPEPLHKRRNLYLVNELSLL